jgi:purine-binding chemotaxis protein CheW
LEDNTSTQLTESLSEYRAFTLGNEEYGFSILTVQEIRGYDSVTKIANTPDYIKGVINLRGSIVTIVDLRLLFGFAKPTYDQFTVVIILNVANRVIGVVVDGVSDVIAFRPNQIKSLPEMGSRFNTEYLSGLGAIEQRMLRLVCIDKLMSSDGIGLTEKLAA